MGRMRAVELPVRLTRQERFDFELNRWMPRLASRSHRLVLRLGRGKIATSTRGIPIGVLTTTGARTGKARSVPLMYLPDGPRFVVVAANAGQDRHPAWFTNLLAHPDAMLNTAGDLHAVRARIVDDDERAVLWPRLVAHNPLYAAFQALTERHTPVVVLEPVA